MGSSKATFEGTIQPWGNSLGIRITRPMCDLSHLDKGDKVAIEVTENGLLISKVKASKPLKLPYSEADLLSGLTAHKAHADELPGLLDGELGN